MLIEDKHVHFEVDMNDGFGFRAVPDAFVIEMLRELYPLDYISRLARVASGGVGMGSPGYRFRAAVSEVPLCRGAVKARSECEYAEECGLCTDCG